MLEHLDRCLETGEMPDVVLLDLNLPVMSGHEVLRAIREKEALSGLVVIVFTSSAYRQEITEAYVAGANAYVTKPARLADLDRLVQVD